MPRYKQTEIGLIPEDWKVVRLKDGEYFRIIQGENYPTKDLRKEGYPVFGANGIIGYGDRFHYEEPVVVVTCRGSTCGTVNITLPKSFVTHNAMAILPLKEPIDTFFLYYALSQTDFSKAISGTGQPQITKASISIMKIPLPPLEEQKKIAQILSTVDEAIEKTDEAIEKTQRLKKGLMNELLTKGIGHKEFKQTEIGTIPEEWLVVKLEEVFKVETGTTPSTKNPEFWENGNIMWITPNDLSKNKISIFIKDSERKITQKALEKNNLTLVKPYSIILSTRAPVGYVAVNLVETAFNQGCKALVPKTELDTTFFAYHLLFIRKKLESLSGGSTFKELSKPSLKSILIPLPPLEEQKKIAEILSTVDERLDLLHRKKEKLTKIKKALMNDLLTGKRRVIAS